VRVDLGKREVAERKADAVGAALESLDLAKRLARVRALVVAVLDDDVALRRPADVVDRFVKRLHHVLPSRQAGRGRGGRG
jgi:hypothetical protein